MRWITVEEEAQKALEHFGINDDEIKGNGFWIIKNTEISRKNLGIGNVPDINGDEIKKAQIIIDYDSDFPLIVKRIIS